MVRLTLPAAAPRPPVDKTSPSPFGPPLHDLVNHALLLNRYWQLGDGMRRNPNFPPGWFTPMNRRA